MHAAAEPPLSLALRTATGEAHRRLETALDLLSEPLREERFLQVLEGFYGFHLAWEPAMAAASALAPLMRSASRLDHLRQDLKALGRSRAQIDALPACPDAARLVADPLQALGSLYVVEGSALGGQVIARALARTAWAPPGGLVYFNPHGPETGARWRAFKAALDAAASPADWPKVIAGAEATFDALRHWLARPQTVAPVRADA